MNSQGVLAPKDCFGDQMGIFMGENDGKKDTKCVVEVGTLIQ